MKSSVGKKLKKLCKRTSIYTCTLALILPAPVHAQALMQGVGMALNLFQGVTQQMQQSQMQAMQAAQMQQQMAQLEPYPVQDELLGCPVPPAVTDYPEGACQASPAPGDEAGLASLDSFVGLSVSHESFYENMLSEAQNTNPKLGIQCLKENKDKLLATIQNKINSLMPLISQAKKEIDLFKAENQKVKEAMEDVRAKLYGNPTNQDDKTQNLLPLFGGQCQEYLSGTGRVLAQNNGLSGLRDQILPINSKAGKMLNDSSSLEAELRSQVQGLEKEIERGGLSVLQDAQSIEAAIFENGSTTQFGAMRTIIQSKARNVQRNIKILQDDLAAVGFQIDESDFDGNFQERFKNFSEGAFNYFRKEAINDCVSGRGSMGTGLTTDQILNGLRHRSVGGVATSLDNYKLDLKSILDSDAFIQEKMQAIKTLDSNYNVGEIYIQIKRPGKSSAPLTPYALYQQQIEICEAKVASNKTFSTNSNERANLNGSQLEKIQRAERALRSALTIEKEFVTSLSVAIYNRVRNCQGIEYKSNSCSLDNQETPLLDTASSNFCIGHAQTCSRQINNCFAQTESLIETKKQEMKALASQYNAQVSGIVATQEQYLNQLKNQVLTDVQYINSFIPKATFEYPPDLFVKLPNETMVAELGVSIRGGGSTKNIDNLPDQMEKLIPMLEKQKDKVQEYLEGTYIKNRRESILANLEKWSGLKQQCYTAMNNYNEGANESNQAQQEALGESSNFCRKFDALSTNPAAGCGEADQLFEDSVNITAGLANPNATQYAALEYKRFCDTVNNESDDGADDGSVNERFYQLAEECQDGSNETFEEQLLDDFLANLPPLSDEEKEYIDKKFDSDPDNDISMPSSLRSKPQVKSNIYRISRVLDSEAYDPPAFPSTDDGEMTTDFIKEIIGVDSQEALREKWNDSESFCARYALDQKVQALIHCDGKDSDESKRCYEDRINEEESRNISQTPDSAARALASIYTNSTNSDSMRIGEVMQGTPCMAQQGYNGNNGFNIQDIDASILGQEAMNVINQLSR